MTTTTSTSTTTTTTTTTPASSCYYYCYDDDDDDYLPPLLHVKQPQTLRQTETKVLDLKMFSHFRSRKLTEAFLESSRSGEVQGNRVLEV